MLVSECAVHLKLEWNDHGETKVNGKLQQQIPAAADSSSILTSAAMKVSVLGSLIRSALNQLNLAAGLSCNNSHS